jgi:hypothetical protein
MAEDKRFDPARLEQIERRLQALEDAEAIRNLKAPLRGARGDPDFLPGSVGHLLLRDPLQLEWPHRGGRRYRASPLVSVHAVHGGRRKSSGVARRHRSRDVRPDGWNLDVPPQAVGAADERPVRDWLGQDAFRVTGVSADRLSNVLGWFT